MTHSQPSGTSASRLEADDIQLLARLKEGDEAAFTTLVEHFQASMVRLASLYVHDHRLAEEVVQDTWIAVLQGIDRFEGRSALKTWLYSILINRAKTHAQREAHYVTAGDLMSDDDANDEPTIDPSRFLGSAHEGAGHWATLPANWEHVPEVRLLSQEVRQVIQTAINALPAMQRQVITLRDVEELDAEQACALLKLTEGNQRVLLHRARAAVRQTLDTYLDQHSHEFVTSA
jgi:RNA polymerase sigma-70 factor, ECF subfamily